MNDLVKIKSALLSVYSKEGIAEIAKLLTASGVQVFSTGGTYDHLLSQGIVATAVESVTAYPSILGGRVKTLHPKIFGGILWRREQLSDTGDIEKYGIPSIDLVVVDLYPFEKTSQSTENEAEIIEKIDIGGISLIRAAAKNYSHVVVIPAACFFNELKDIFEKSHGTTTLKERRRLAAAAFNISSHYDTAIFNYFNKVEKINAFKQSALEGSTLRYGENPHQNAIFYGDLKQVFNQLHGKELSYNNLVDIDAAVHLIGEFSEPTVAIIKHTNPCGVATRSTFKEAFLDALACDPVSAFGGIIIANGTIDRETAEELNKLFFEIVIAKEYENDSLELLKTRKNRIILQNHSFTLPHRQFKTILNGILLQEKDLRTEQIADFQVVTTKKPGTEEMEALIFANKIVKHLKSNAIALVKNNQLLGCGMGQTSRVDALRQAIVKAGAFGFDLKGAVMASDAFFPFSDSVGIAGEAGITAILQPGGSIRDAESVKYCNEHQLSMVFTGVRHFKH